MAYFYPPLVRGLGYKDPIMAQYMTVSYTPRRVPRVIAKVNCFRSPSGSLLLSLPCALAGFATGGHTIVRG